MLKIFKPNSKTIDSLTGADFKVFSLKIKYSGIQEILDENIWNVISKNLLDIAEFKREKILMQSTIIIKEVGQKGKKKLKKIPFKNTGFNEKNLKLFAKNVLDVIDEIALAEVQITSPPITQVFYPDRIYPDFLIKIFISENIIYFKFAFNQIFEEKIIKELENNIENIKKLLQSDPIEKYIKQWAEKYFLENGKIKGTSNPLNFQFDF